MSISTNIDGEFFKINVVDLLSSLSGDQENKLIQQLACSDQVIKHVADQIINHCTDDGYTGWQESGHEPSTPLSIARREVSKGSSDLAKREIEDLERKCKSLDESYKEYMTKYYDLLNKTTSVCV